MACDEGLAFRIREYLETRSPEREVVEKKMFGGLCFMVGGHMCVGIVGDTLMARVGAEQYAEDLLRPGAREMDFTGKSMKGMLYVGPEALAEDEVLYEWIERCAVFTESLPPKRARS